MKAFAGMVLASAMLAQPAAAQNYVHGVLAMYKPQQLAINGCMGAGYQRGVFHACMLPAGYKFCSSCRILGIGGYSCDSLLPSSTTSDFMLDTKGS